MLSEPERKVLELVSKQLLVTKGEILNFLNKEKCNGTDVILQRLRDSGYIEKVESLGTCFVITQRGIRAIKGEE
ncbi:MAG: hypothetical protein QXN71_01555 [Candidatus Aenigmatarchaeota archaeon]